MGGCQRWGWGWMRELSVSGQRVQTSTYEINKSWGCNAWHGDCTVLYFCKLLKE